MCFVEPPNKKSTKKEKKPTTFTCYDLLSKWFWWWAGIHSRLWIIYLHYWVSQWIHKIDVQMRDSKCDELLPHKGSQSLSASVQSERQWLQDCWEVSKHCFLLYSCNPFGEGKFILDSTPKCSPNWHRPSNSVCWDLLFEKVRQKSKTQNWKLGSKWMAHISVLQNTICTELDSKWCHDSNWNWKNWGMNPCS